MNKKLQKLALTSQLLLSAVMLVAIGSGCESPISDVSDMKNSTSQMTQTTQKMADTTDSMSKTTSGMASTTTDLDNKTTDVLGLTGEMDRVTDSLYVKEREGGALELRKEMLKSMDKAKTMEAKIAFAGAYYMAFEYQLWEGSSGDDQDRLEALYLNALQEFSREVMDYMPEDYKENPGVDPTKKDNKSMNLYALSVTMHEENIYEAKQLIDPSNPNLKPDYVGMYDLLAKGLSKKADRDSGKLTEDDLKGWEKEVLNDEQEFEYLIRVRENFLPAMVLAQISQIGENGATIIPGLLHMGDLRALMMLMRPWTADLKDVNTEQLVTFTTWLNDPTGHGAFGARALLEELNVDASMNEDVVKLYRNMQFDDTGLPPADKISESSTSPSPYDAFKQAVADLLHGA